MELRGATQEKDASGKLKGKTRERTSGSGMGKLDIDYQTLHDAFFRFQTKPRLTSFGDLYWEGKEFEVEMVEKRPGLVSAELREALGMPDQAPPPWLHNMQRFGPPPSYPNLRIPGLNAPLPPGAEWGFQPGGWGRPAVDPSTLQPLFQGGGAQEEPALVLEGAHWGQLQQEEAPQRTLPKARVEEGEEEEGEEELPSPLEEGLATPLSGLETPQNLEGTLRKRRLGEEGPAAPLYQVLAERGSSVGSALMGSDRTYVVPEGPERVDLLKSQRTEQVELALAPEELDKLSQAQLQKRFDAALQERKGGEDTRKRKREEEDAEERAGKKKKEYKF